MIQATSVALQNGCRDGQFVVIEEWRVRAISRHIKLVLLKSLLRLILLHLERKPCPIDRSLVLQRTYKRVFRVELLFLTIVVDDHVDRLLAWSLVGPLTISVVATRGRSQRCAQHVHKVLVDSALTSAATSLWVLAILLSHGHVVS